MCIDICECRFLKILSPGLFSTFCDMLSFYSENLLVPHPSAFIHILYLVYFTCIKMTVFLYIYMQYIVWYDWVYIIVSPNDAPHSFSNACFYGNHEPHLLRKKQEEDNLATTLLSVLCCRLREGYTIKVLNISVEVAASFVICTYIISVSDKAS